ncbi:glycoside hydrolase family 16 protein [Wolfiporia cocos MD-104 SS10]|uniref:Glycoside hydrolase family 16 protein n=1 Tax=Wolfiporia cocos (strain MD-104) TaxID=742152 RepID=A0A2H3JHK8_WOLCO|nr:glycoside hydrolase family 16 protein [Wolfiporia cocos MD-104 SS10]
MRTGVAILSLVSVLIPAASTQFTLADVYVGNDFFNGWSWQTINDPTNGRVNYVSQGVARGMNLSYATDTKFFMRADDYNIVPPNTRGRNSVRILSNKAYGDSLAVLDLQHMPEGCSTWPAFWSLSQKGPWPAGGEIDIIEGVNMDTQNLMSLHTSPGCTMPQQRLETGTVTSTNCDANVNYNQGCGVQDAAGSFGVPFNARGGGWYAMARTQQDGIRVWFWPRDSPDVPLAVRAPVPGLFPTIMPDPTWGAPVAAFPIGPYCDYAAHFDAHQFVFDLTFCGDLAGNVYTSTGCSGSCVDFVNNNPQAFTNAYWEVNSLRIYTATETPYPPIV